MNLKRYLTIVFCVVGVCLAVISGFLAAAKLFGPITDTSPELNQVMDVPVKGRANILFIGVDNDQARTDTMILGSLDTKNKKLSVISIPRDTRILYDGMYDKLTHVYGYGKGEQATIEAVKQVTGIPIHYYVVLDFEGFRSLIDALGGVDVEVPHVPNAWSKGRRGMYYEDPAQDLYIELPEGPQHLDGAQAEGFVRFRYGYAEADMERQRTQQYFIRELLKQKFTLGNITKVPELYKMVSKHVKTNLSVSDMASYLMTVKDMDLEQDVQMFQMPGYATNAETRYGVLSCFIYDEEETDALMQQYFMSSVSAGASPAPSKENE